MSPVVWVTGGANGIGLATARAFGQRGYKVVISDLELDSLQSASDSLIAEGMTCLAIPCDVAQENDCIAAVRQIEASFGRLDCAVNNAGISGGGPHRGRTADYDVGMWHHVLNVNLTGVFFSARAQIPAVLRAGGGAIVNVSSIMGMAGTSEIPAYVAAKHGVLGLTKAIADEYGAAGLRCNALAPGMIATRLNKRFEEDGALKEAALRRIPQGRFGRPEEIAEAIFWLCAPQASFVNGLCLTVDGGQLIRA